MTEEIAKAVAQAIKSAEYAKSVHVVTDLDEQIAFAKSHLPANHAEFRLVLQWVRNLDPSIGTTTVCRVLTGSPVVPEAWQTPSPESISVWLVALDEGRTAPANSYYTTFDEAKARRLVANSSTHVQLSGGKRRKLHSIKHITSRDEARLALANSQLVEACYGEPGTPEYETARLLAADLMAP